MPTEQIPIFQEAFMDVIKQIRCPPQNRHFSNRLHWLLSNISIPFNLYSLILLWLIAHKVNRSMWLTKNHQISKQVHKKRGVFHTNINTLSVIHNITRGNLTLFMALDLQKGTLETHSHLLKTLPLYPLRQKTVKILALN